MPRSIVFLFSLLLSFCSFGQEKVDWTISYDLESESVVFTAQIEEGWHLYSQRINGDLGPVPTSFEFEPNKQLYKLVGKTKEPTPITKYDPNFEGDLSFFEDSVQFTQRIKMKSSGEIRGEIAFMVCTDSMCLPPEYIDFNLMINNDEK